MTYLKGKRYDGTEDLEAIFRRAVSAPLPAPLVSAHELARMKLEHAAASKRGRRSRTKGKVWERAVAALLRPIFGDAKRGFQSRSGRDGCDVEGTPLWVECKHGALVNLRAALKQAIEDTDGRPPVVIAKDDRSAPLAVMRLSDWLELVHAAHAAGVVRGLQTAPDDDEKT